MRAFAVRAAVHTYASLWINADVIFAGGKPRSALAEPPFCIPL
ncbi:MAG TPA: hypothetical protein VMV92_35030 [Streptosporangiaceae bacterium]|nr:hypothetical protein [Streptosporangiaceae bacterium]